MTPTEFVSSLVDDKCDPDLGRKVMEHLQKLGLVPVIDESPAMAPTYNPKVAVQQLEQGISSAFTMLGLDVRGDPSIRDTPRRFAKMMVGELTRGLNFDFFPKMTVVPNGTGWADNGFEEPTIVGAYNQMVLVKDIAVMSLCEHHLQTIDGFVHIAYIPGSNVLGLSKFARVAEFFARRPQIQERMTDQIYHALKYVLETDDIAVVMSATHFCMRARGVSQHQAVTITDKLGGRFMTNPALRQEFFDRVN